MKINNIIPYSKNYSSNHINKQYILPKTEVSRNFSDGELSIRQKDVYYRPILSFKSNSRACRSILKTEELKHILKNVLLPENFSTGIDFRNVLNGTFKANLHMHSTYSDGRMSVAEILDQSVKYADYRKSLGKNDPYIFALTDHGTMEGAKEAINLISQNPEKYQNLSFVPGIEINAQHNGKQLEVVGYCLNPSSQIFQQFLDKAKLNNRNYVRKLLTEKLNPFEQKMFEQEKGISSSPQLITTLEDLFIMNKNIKMGGSSSFMHGVNKSLIKIFEARGWLGEKSQIVSEIAQEHKHKYGSLSINPDTPSIKEIHDAVMSSGSGFIGIAHPARNLPADKMPQLFTEFKSSGTEAVESNYYGKKSLISHNRSLKLLAKLNGFLNAGGQDNHKDNIFSQLYYLKDLPEKISQIIS